MPIKIGVIQGLSGSVSSLGKDQVRGIELAIDAHHGKILGRTVSLQIEDDGCSGEGGANAALKIVADPKTVAVIGTTCSGSAGTASKIVSEAGLTMVSGNNSAPFLTSIGGEPAPDYHPGYFRTAPNEEYSGQAAALFAFRNLGIRKAATINDGDIYTTGLTNGFIKKFKELGGEIVFASSINKGETIMRPILTAAFDAEPQLLFFPLFQPEGDYILLQARQFPQSKNTVLMSDGSLIQSNFIDSVKERGIGMYFVGPSFPENDATRQLTTEYRKKYAVAPENNYFLSAYDASGLLFAAMEKAAVQGPDGTIHIGRQFLRDCMYSTTGFNGATGNLSCNKFGDCASPAFNILRLDDPSAGLPGLLANVVDSFSFKN